MDNNKIKAKPAKISSKQAKALYEILKENSKRFEQLYKIKVKDVQRAGLVSFFALMGVEDKGDLRKMLASKASDVELVHCPHCKVKFGMFAPHIREIGLCNSCAPLYEMSDFWAKVEKISQEQSTISTRYAEIEGDLLKLSEEEIKNLPKDKTKEFEEVANQYNENYILYNSYIMGFLKEQNIRIMHKKMSKEFLISKVATSRFRGAYTLRYLLYRVANSNPLESILDKIKHDFDEVFNIKSTRFNASFEKFYNDIEAIIKNGTDMKEELIKYAYSILK
jgi:hypothetical protein